MIPDGRWERGVLSPGFLYVSSLILCIWFRSPNGMDKLIIMINYNSRWGLVSLMKWGRKTQLTKKVAFLVFYWSTSPTFPPGVVCHDLSLYLGIISRLLFLVSSFTLLSLFDLDTRKAAWCNYVCLLVFLKCISYWEKLTSPFPLCQ